MSRPRVGVSRCLLGDRVRYDGGHKRQAEVLDILAAYAELVPVCPEVEMEMGVPREPIELRDGSDRILLMGRESGTDYTDRATVYNRRRMDELRAERISGFVLKARSPSCGPAAVPVHRESGWVAGVGLFAAALMAAFPGMPLIDESGIADDCRRGEFLHAVAAYAAIQPI